MNDPINITLEPQVQHEIQPREQVPPGDAVNRDLGRYYASRRQQNSQLPGTRLRPCLT
jgi:hypothetical protein